MSIPSESNFATLLPEDGTPLVSVIIPTYNHATYLPQAIESVLRQDYPHKEIVVVDDGSTDNTKEVVAAYTLVHYVHQRNAGLSAARNTGIDNSRGDCLVFLDADDWFFPGALANLVKTLLQHPRAAFAYGSYETVTADNEIVPEQRQKQDFGEDIFIPLLKDNFITLPAAVLYRRWVFDRFRFDLSYHSCSDYEMYLNAARHHPVAYCPQVVGAYRRHGQNMSNNTARMQREVLAMLKRQSSNLQSQSEKEQWRQGLQAWRNRYGAILLWHLEQGKFFSADPKMRSIRAALVQHNKRLFLKYIRTKAVAGLKKVFKKFLPG